jgi:hypothetical protein
MGKLSSEKREKVRNFVGAKLDKALRLPYNETEESCEIRQTTIHLEKDENDGRCFDEEKD